jgi:hypothetical protein
MSGLGADPTLVAFQPIDEAAVLPVIAQHRTDNAAGLAAVQLRSKSSKFCQRVPPYSASLDAKVTPVQSATGAGEYIGAFAGMSAARVALVSAAIDTVASKNLFIVGNLCRPAESFACHAVVCRASSDRMTRLRFPRRMWRIRNVVL